MTTAEGRGITAVAAAAVGLGAALGFIPGFVATALQDDLGVSRAEIGLLVGIYFGCTGLGSVIGGRLTDRFGARAVVVVDMVVVTLAAVLGAAVGTYGALLVGAAAAGAGYSLANAGTNVAIANAVPVDHLTTAMSTKTAGVPTMAAVTALLGPWSADRWNWPLLLWVVAALAAVTAVAAFVVLDDERPAPQPAGGTGEAGALPARFVWFPIGAFLLIAGSQPLYSWVVPYLEQSLDVSPAAAGAVSALASAVGVAAMVVNGRRADSVGASHRLRRIMGLTSVSALGTALILSGPVVGIGAVAVGTTIGAAAQLSAIGTMHAAIAAAAPGAVGLATGWTMTGYYLGALAAPFGFGILVDATGMFAIGWLAAAGFLVVSIGAWWRAGSIVAGGAVGGGPQSEGVARWDGGRHG